MRWLSLRRRDYAANSTPTPRDMAAATEGFIEVVNM